MKYLLAGLMALSMLASTALAQSDSGNPSLVTVRIVGFHNDRGQVLLSIFNQGDGFPGKEEKAYKNQHLKIEGGAAVTNLELAPGEYAIVAAHDENANGVFDTNFLGIPKEASGVSNDAKSLMGPPKFKDAKLKFASGGRTVEIKIAYR